MAGTLMRDDHLIPEEGRRDGPEDLTSLEQLTAATITDALEKRWRRSNIYTYVGDVTVAVNPYRNVNIYSGEFHRLYTNALSRTQNPPHIYWVADHAYQRMCSSNADQVLLISGESGAGKTETTKFIVEHLSHICGKRADNLHEKILQVNPLLEAFGNAKTTLNNNSSRFGKFIQMNFNRNGVLKGAQIETYLLEKARVVHHGVGERTFHVFYCLLAGMSAEEQTTLLLETPDSYNVLRPQGASQYDTAVYADQAEYQTCGLRYAKLRQIMQAIGMVEADIDFINVVLASILHVTNIDFESSTDNHTDGVYVSNAEALEAAARLLAIEGQDLNEALVNSTYEIRGVVGLAAKSKVQAREGRDALAKALYHALFTWLVKKVNLHLQGSSKTRGGSGIGILDLSGFEDLPTNGFDQLLINVANERLQFYFNEYLFSREQREMEEGGIDWSKIHYENNADILSLFYGDRRPGLLDITDEESGLRQSTDDQLVYRLHDQLAAHSHYIRPRHNGLVFIIEHFAGRVEYHAHNFLEKNRDKLGGDLRLCLERSADPLVSGLLGDEPIPTGTGTRSRRQHTVIRGFTKSLFDLMEKLSRAQPLFVRCVKPNRRQNYRNYDGQYVREQLQYNGLLELAKIRRIGFPVRLEIPDFAERYHILLMRPLGTDLRQGCHHVIRLARLHDAEIGTEKVFLKEWHRDQLDHALRRLSNAVLGVQRMRRGQRRGDRFVAVVREAMRRKRELISIGVWDVPTVRSPASAPNVEVGERMNQQADGASSATGSELVEPTEADDQQQKKADDFSDDIGALPRRYWDVFRSIPHERISASESFEGVMQCLKVAMYVLLFGLILGGLVFNKITLLLMTAKIGITESVQDPDIYQLKARNGYVTLLAICLIVPHAISFVVNTLKGLFSNQPWPGFLVCIQFLLVESAHTTGVCLLVFRVLPQVDMGRGLFILALSCTVPAFFKLVFGRPPYGKMRISTLAVDSDGPENELDKSSETSDGSVHQYSAKCGTFAIGLWYLTTLISLCVQAVCLGGVSIGGFQYYWTNGTAEGNSLFENRTDVRDAESVGRFAPEATVKFEDIWVVPVSLLLISTKWLENFVDKDLTFCGSRLRLPVMRMKANWHQVRLKATILTSAWSAGIIVGLPFLLFDNFALHAYGIRDSYNPRTMYKYYEPAIIHCATGIIVYGASIVACKVCMQKFCFNLSVFLATPLALIMLYVWCYVEPLPLGHLWICPEHWTEVPTNSITQWHLAVMVIWWLASQVICSDTWWSKQNRMDQTEKLFVTPSFCGAILEQSMMMNRRRHDDRVDLQHGAVKLKGAEPSESKADGATAGGSTDTLNGVKQRETESGPGKRRGGRGDNMSRKDKKEKDKTHEEIVPMVYACATMWHENKTEMTQLMKSIFRMDRHQSARRLQKIKIGIYDPEYFDFQTHIIFDDAFTRGENGEFVVNDWVKQLNNVINDAASSVHECAIALSPALRTPTPYGGRLTWTLPGGTLLIIHLKDKNKIRHRKRWSQCMYMYYLLGYRLIGLSEDALWNDMGTGGRDSQSFHYQRSSIFKHMPKDVVERAENTFVLALDGDVDFKPGAVRLLLDLMKNNKNVASACGRIHPIGSGPMVWYQVFQYAIAHWLQKVAEHVFGCVLCSPGCFSLFRCSALMDDNVMRTYLTTAEEPHEFIQYDQGEDRWLCTLLLQQGYRVEYCAGSDALTYAPESLPEYFTQQRRWITSTMANIMDLLGSYKSTVAKNTSISYFYMIYQFVLFAASLLGPATIIMMIAGSYNAILGTALLQSYLLGLSPAIFYTLICLLTKNNTQIIVGIFLSAIYAIVMMIVVVALVVNAHYESITSPNVAFLVAITILFLCTALLHPQELLCITPGILYIFAIPFGSLFLIIYSISNMHVVTWGTRESPKVRTPAEIEAEQKELELKKQKKQESGIFRMLGINVNDFKEFFNTILLRSRNDETSKLDQMGDRIGRMEEMLQNVVVDSTGQGSSQRKARNELREMLDKKMSADDTNNTANIPVKAEVVKRTVAPTKEPVVPRDDLLNPAWVEDKDFKKGPLRHIDPREAHFWKGLLKHYLHPIDDDKKKQEAHAAALKTTRNNAVIGISMLNVMWIILIFLFQILKEVFKDQLFIPIPRAENGNIQFFEPVGLVFLGFFAILLALQFIATLTHRFNTLLHLISITEIKWPWRNHIGGPAKDLQSAIQLANHLQSFTINEELAFLEPAADYDLGPEPDYEEDQYASLRGTYGRRPDSGHDAERGPRHHGNGPPGHRPSAAHAGYNSVQSSWSSGHQGRSDIHHRGGRRQPGLGVLNVSGGNLGHNFDRRLVHLQRNFRHDGPQPFPGANGPLRNNPRRQAEIYRTVRVALDRRQQQSYNRGYR